MITTLHLLSIGARESNELFRESLLSRADCRLLTAKGVWDLSAFLTAGKIDVAILHNTLSPGELRSCAVYIRRHWPCTRILLIRARVEILDDPMYDERIMPGSSAELLFAIVQSLAGGASGKALRVLATSAR